MNTQTNAALVELAAAAKPLADLLEYPGEQEAGKPVMLEVYPEDIARLQAALNAIDHAL